MTREEIIERMSTIAPNDLDFNKNPSVLAELCVLTQRLIQNAGGRLEDPFWKTESRTIAVSATAVNWLKGSRLLVTGGNGFIGRRLIRKLCDYSQASITSLDNRILSDVEPSQIKSGPNKQVTVLDVDVLNYEILERLFDEVRPEVVFHLAAQRVPSIAEENVLLTMENNILGTENIVRACERSSVDTVVFASSGKAARYITRDVYAGTKKLGESIVQSSAERANLRYAIVRFTHLFESSIFRTYVSTQMENKLPIALYDPFQYLYMQSTTEAIQLLLNGVAYASRGCSVLLATADLGWPGELLKYVLYQMKEHGDILPIRFIGYPPGYSEPPFPGQIPTVQQSPANVMLNRIEAQTANLAPTNDVLMSKPTLISSNFLSHELEGMRLLLADAKSSNLALKEYQTDVLQRIATTCFLETKPQLLLNILADGIQPKELVSQDLSAPQTLAALLDGVRGRVSKDDLIKMGDARQRLQAVLESCIRLPDAEWTVRLLLALLQGKPRVES